MTAELPYREKVIACERGGTYKYFLGAARVEPVWAALVLAYGPIVKDPAFATIQIESTALIIRATLLGNPITVFRKRACTPDDVTALHRVLEYPEERG